MTSINEPSKFVTPFAESGLKNPIPATANNTTGKAGFDKGFPERTMLPKASGGIPPSGMDFNGILYDITSAIRYMQAGGKPTYDAAFAAAIGGYPSGAVLLGDDGTSVFQNAVAGNETDPNSGGAGWTRPDLQVMELYRRSYAEAGYNVVGTFQAGFTYVNANDVGIDLATGKGFTGPVGPVAAGTDPASSGFVDRSGDITVSVGTYAQLRSYAGTASKIYCLGRANVFDKAFGYFYINSADTATVDDDATVLVDALGRRWERQFTGNADVRWWGAVEMVESSAAFNNAAKYSARTRRAIWVDGEYHLNSPIIAGSAGENKAISFVGPTAGNMPSGGFAAKLRFHGCDGFRVVQKNVLTLDNILLDGDRGATIPSDYGPYLLGLTKSAIRSNEDTANVNCIVYVHDCRFEKWNLALDFSRGAWSSEFFGNSISYCYQAGNHFRPNNTKFRHNSVSYCTRGFLLTEQNAGEFVGNELNAGKTSEWLLKLSKPAVCDVSSNYVEYWEGTPVVGPDVNYGKGFIPFIVEMDRFTAGLAQVDNNKIDAPTAYCGILYVQAPGQENNNFNSFIQMPRGNAIVAANNKFVVAAATGASDLNMCNWIAADGIYMDKLNGSANRAVCVGAGTITKMVKAWPTRADITTGAGASAPLAGTADVVFDTTGGALHPTSGVQNPSGTRRKVKLTISVHAETDATAANTAFTVSKFNAIIKTFNLTVPANSKVDQTFVFYQDASSTVSDFSVKLNGGGFNHPTTMTAEIIRETFISS